MRHGDDHMSRHFPDVKYASVPLPPINGAAKPNQSNKSARRWFELTTLVEQIGPTLKGSEFHVLVVIFQKADAKTKVARLSHQTIANLVGLQRRQVVKLVRSLIDKQHIELARRGRAATNQPNHYRYRW